jgi:hypothetical protein
MGHPEIVRLGSVFSGLWTTISKDWGNMNVRSEVSALAVAAIFSTLIGVTYAFFIPAFFPNYRAGWILHLGVLLATSIAGYIGFHESTAGKLPVRIILGFCYAAVIAILVYFLSLLIILNVRGS